MNTRAASIEYWNGYAKWYDLWVDHNRYHDDALCVLTSFVQPGWRVLDIGAGRGVLSYPLAAMGCEVTALEPADGMRRLLQREGRVRGLRLASVDTRRWEDLDAEEDLRPYDLIIACNSLHLTRTGFEASLRKVFAMRPRHVFIVSECVDRKEYDSLHDEYTTVYAGSYITDSSFAYHSLIDAIEHSAYRHGCCAERGDRNEALSGLTFEEGHYWKKGTARVCVCFLRRKASAVVSYHDKESGYVNC